MPVDCNLAPPLPFLTFMAHRLSSRDLSDCYSLVVEARALGLSSRFYSVASSLSQYIRHSRPAINMGCGLVLKNKIPAFHTFNAGKIQRVVLPGLRNTRWRHAPRKLHRRRDITKKTPIDWKNRI